MPQDQDPAAGSGSPADFGIYSRPQPEPGIAPSDIAAAVASLGWLMLVGGLYFFTDAASGPGGALMLLVATVLPIALIWVAAITLKTARGMRAEAQRLQAAVDAMRKAYAGQAPGNGIVRAATGLRIEASVPPARPAAQAGPAAFASRREAQTAAPMTVEQPALALGTPAEAETSPVPAGDIVRALNFPDSPADQDGFRALRRALEDRSLAKLIRAAQDVLTLLSQDGIYMDDLVSDRARPELWRRFAQGERGRAISGLGGVRDRSSLALSAARMRQDTIFRDAAHHFLRQFDRAVAEFEKTASDAEIAALAETRTARAFMLLGRVTGIFD